MAASVSPPSSTSTSALWRKLPSTEAGLQTRPTRRPSTCRRSVVSSRSMPGETIVLRDGDDTGMRGLSRTFEPPGEEGAEHRVAVGVEAEMRGWGAVGPDQQHVAVDPRDLMDGVPRCRGGPS